MCLSVNARSLSAFSRSCSTAATFAPSSTLIDGTVYLGKDLAMRFSCRCSTAPEAKAACEQDRPPWLEACLAARAVPVQRLRYTTITDRESARHGGSSSARCPGTGRYRARPRFVRQDGDRGG